MMTTTTTTTRTAPASRKGESYGKAQRVTPNQMELLIANAPSPRYALLWRLQREVAGRISETLNLRWKDITGTHVKFRAVTTKTKTTRQLPMSTRLKAAIATYRQVWIEEHDGNEPRPEEYLFHSRFNTVEPMTSQAADLALRSTCKRLGLEGVRSHSFRRSAAMDAADRGISVHKIRGLTGHASLDGLAHYLEATDEDILACLE